MVSACTCLELSHLIDKALGQLSQDIRCDLGDTLAVLSNQPQNAGAGHGHRNLVHHAGHVADDALVLIGL